MVIGHQRAERRKDARRANFGMARPGYRKTLRLMKPGREVHAGASPSWTPGAYPGIGAEERSQSEAIGATSSDNAAGADHHHDLIGEGGSGGALAISVGVIRC